MYPSLGFQAKVTMAAAKGFLKPSMDDDFFGSTWKEDRQDLVRSGANHTTSEFTITTPALILTIRN
jgi:hypothetical protein